MEFIALGGRGGYISPGSETNRTVQGKQIPDGCWLVGGANRYILALALIGEGWRIRRDLS